MDREERESLEKVMVASDGYQVDSAIINGDSCSRSVTPDSLIETGDRFLSGCSRSDNIIMENSDAISAVSLESAYCRNASLDDVSSTISNTNSCPEFTRQPDPAAVFSQRIQPSNHTKYHAAPNLSINTHKKIRRIPSGANPRHRVSTLYRPQRSQSVPQLQINPAQLPRRFSQQLTQGALPNFQVQQRTNVSGSRTQQQSLPQIHQKLPQQQQQQQSSTLPQQQQQQIIYLQIPNSVGSQSFDSQELQLQISSQLHQLVPQICTQLLQQMGPNDSSQPAGRSPAGIPNQITTKTSEDNVKGTNNQIHRQNNDSATVTRRANPRKRKKNMNYQLSNDQSIEVVNETDSDSSLSSQQQSHSYSTTSGVPTYSAVPQLTIPLSQELLLRCQQLRDQPVYYTYQPRLETIHEESLSLKHFKVNNLSKPKIMACILTILSVIVVIVLAGDRTVAVIIVTVIFIIFFLGLIGFLYLNSSKDQNFLAAKDSRSIQVGPITSGNKSSVA